MEAEAAQVYPTAIQIALIKNRFEQAHDMMQVFEQKSGLFDAQGNIEPTREIYYYNKGIYYLGVSQLDSAEVWFRKTACFHEILLDAYRGLLGLYCHKQEADSIQKYANLYEAALADYLRQTKTTAIALSKSLYDYGQQQKIAQEQKRKSDALFLIIIAGGLFAVIAAIGIYQWARRRKAKEMQLLEEYHTAKENLYSTRQEVEILRQSISRTEDQNVLLEKKAAQVDLLESLVEELRSKIEKSSALMAHENHQEFQILQLFRTISMPHSEKSDGFRKNISARAATEEEWKEFEENVQTSHPSFYLFMQQYRISALKYRVGLLSRYGFTNSQIAALLGTSAGSITNARISLAKDLFGLSSARELNRYLISK